MQNRRVAIMVGHSEAPKPGKETELDGLYALELKNMITEDKSDEINNGYMAVIVPPFIEMADKNKALMEKIYWVNGKGNLGGVARADLCIDLHCNWSNTNKEAKGFNIFYNELKTAMDKEVAKKGRYLAECCSNQLIKHGFSFWGDEAIAEDHLAGCGNLAVCSYMKVPAILIEMGFLSNGKDAMDLENPLVRKRFCLALFNGIKDYCKVVL